jgi:hypothetical protein
MDLTGEPKRVVAIVPDPAVEALGVRISGGNSAFYGLVDIAALVDEDQFRPPATTTYRFEDVAVAQERSETGHPGGTKLVLVP